MSPKLLVLSVSVIALAGCGYVPQGGFQPQPFAPSYVPPNGGGALQPAFTNSPRLLLFGGDDHKVFLGSPTDGKFSTDSIFNEFGDYGSKFANDSIWNQFGEYGSKFSDHSPWNKFANAPPVVVDTEGNFYGYFTENRYHDQVTQVQILVVLLAAHQ
jgi:hypothetical protein